MLMARKDSMSTTLYLDTTLRRLEAVHAGKPLMQRAGAAAAEWAMELAGNSGRPILILAGPGNNGGDAFVAARLLRERFFEIVLVFAGDADRLPAEARQAFEAYSAAGGTITREIPRQHWALIIDGLFGIGLARAPAGHFAALISKANRLFREEGCPLLALDCPSGLDTNTGSRFDPCIQATHTLTFIAAKPGLYTNDGPDCCGELRIAPLDLDPVADLAPDALLISQDNFVERLHPRTRNSHKGTHGSVGILGGAPSMIGAAFLAGRAAIKLGAGRVYVGLIDHAAASYDPVQPELMLRRPQALLQAGLNALACGPGLGISLEASELLEAAIAFEAPLVLDADALNLIASERNLQSALNARALPAILTPHPTEAARLLDTETADIQADRIAAARAISQRFHCHVALKGCGTVVHLADGRWFINSTGNPGMGSAGMGDVLTGIIAALLAQDWTPEQALLAGVHLHGAAADRLVTNGIGPIGLTAGEVIDAARSLFNAWISGQGIRHF